MTCLAWAAGRGYEEIVRELLTYGAKVNATDKVLFCIDIIYFFSLNYFPVYRLHISKNKQFT